MVKKGAEEGVWTRGSFGKGSAADGPHKAKYVFTKIGWPFHLQGTVNTENPDV